MYLYLIFKIEHTNLKSRRVRYTFLKKYYQMNECPLLARCTLLVSYRLFFFFSPQHLALSHDGSVARIIIIASV